MGKNDFCCAVGCKHDRSNGATCGFYSIPSDAKVKNLWLRNISRVRTVKRNGRNVTRVWKPSKSSKLCGCHFDTPPRRKSVAVPSIFSHWIPPLKSLKNFTDRNSMDMGETISNHSLEPVPQESPTAIPDSTDEFQAIPTAVQNSPLAEPESPLAAHESPYAEHVAEPESPVAVPERPVAVPESLDAPESPVAVPECPIAELDRPIMEANQQEPPDHDYLATTEDIHAKVFVNEHSDLLDYIKDGETHKQRSEELESMKDSGQIIDFQHLKNNPKLFLYYTGLSVEVFDGLFSYLLDKAKVMKYPIGARTLLFTHHAEKNKKMPGRARKYSLDEEMFFTLVKLRLGLPTVDCAVRFGMSKSTFSGITTAWITLLAYELENICKMPANCAIDQIEEAKCFEDFANVRIVVDCTELFSETPSSIGAHKQFHSNYKHHTTVKFLVGMNTGGAVTFVSEMYGGRASDKFITNDSVDLLTALNPGEKVMADRGFTIQEDLPEGVKLVIPSFKHKDKSQFSKQELQLNKKISEARVHIERAIRRIKQFQILKTEMKLSQKDVYENIFKACAYLVNFQDPFLKT